MAGGPPLLRGPRRAKLGIDPAFPMDDELDPERPELVADGPGQPDAGGGLVDHVSADGDDLPELPAAGDGPDEDATGGPSGTRPGIVHVVRDFGRTHLGIVAVVCAALLVFAGSQVLAARATTVPDVSTSALAGFSTATSAAASPSPSQAPSEAPRIQMHVTGAVRTPGVHSLPEGARITDALQAAGGLDESADIGELNLAAPACDGCQLVIGTRQAPRGELRAPDAAAATGTGGVTAGGVASPRTGAASGALIDLNTASASALEELPGVGPVIAGRIVDWRTEHKRFSRIEELQEVTGIGPALFEKVKGHVRVS